MNINIKKLTVLGMFGIMSLGLTACSGSDSEEPSTKKVIVKDVDINEVANKVKEAYGQDYIPDMEYDKVDLEVTFGIEEDMYDAIVAEGPIVAFNIDTFIAVKAKEGMADKVEKALENYKEYLINEGALYPANVCKIQAAKVLRYGDYVFFTCLGVIPQSMSDKSDEEIVDYAKEQNQKSINAIESFFEE